MSALALYAHIPFCKAKCAYCDFASYPRREADWERYFRALGEELAAWRPALEARGVATVFLGGGTPSLMPAEAIERLMADVRACARVAPDAEITMEANPGTLTPEKLRRLPRGGRQPALARRAGDGRPPIARARAHPFGGRRARGGSHGAPQRGSTTSAST